MNTRLLFNLIDRPYCKTFFSFSAVICLIVSLVDSFSLRQCFLRDDSCSSRVRSGQTILPYTNTDNIVCSHICMHTAMYMDPRLYTRDTYFSYDEACCQAVSPIVLSRLSQGLALCRGKNVTEKHRYKRYATPCVKQFSRIIQPFNFITIKCMKF